MLKALLILFDELKRRHVFGAVIGYSVVVWVLLQLASIVYEPLGAPAWAMTWTVLLAALGFPLVGVLAWSFDLTREGIRRTDKLPDTQQSKLQRALPLAIVMVAVCGLGYALWGIYRPGTPAKSAGDRVSATQRYFEGRQKWAQRTPRELARARESFAQAIKDDPSYALPYTGLADTILLQVDYDQASLLKAIKEAEPLIHKAVELDPQLSEAFASFGLLKRSVGQYSGAESMLRQALKLDEKNLDALIWLGGLLGQQGRLIEQREMLERAFALDRFNPLSAVNRASNRQQMGEYDAAREILADTRATASANELVIRTEIKLELDAGRLDRAWPDAVKLFTGNPFDASNGGLLVRVMAGFGADEQAAMFTREGMKRIKLSEESDANMRVSLALLDYAQFGKPPTLERVPRGDDPSIDLRSVVTALALSNRLAEARELLQARLEKDLYATPNDIGALLMAAELDRRTEQREAFEQRLKEAGDMIERASQQGAKERQMLVNRAVFASLQRDPDRAVALLRQAHPAEAYVDLFWLKTDLSLGALRQEPVFQVWSEEMTQRTSELRQRLGVDAFSFTPPASLSNAE